MPIYSKKFKLFLLSLLVIPTSSEAKGPTKALYLLMASNMSEGCMDLLAGISRLWD